LPADSFWAGHTPAHDAMAVDEDDSFILEARHQEVGVSYSYIGRTLTLTKYSDAFYVRLPKPHSPGEQFRCNLEDDKGGI